MKDEWTIGHSFFSFSYRSWGSPIHKHLFLNSVYFCVCVFMYICIHVIIGVCVFKIVIVCAYLRLQDSVLCSRDLGYSSDLLKVLGWVAEPQSLKGPICELYIIKCLSYLATVSCQNLVHLLQIIYHTHNLDKIVKEAIFYFALENYWLKFLVLWFIVLGARHFAVCVIVNT